MSGESLKTASCGGGGGGGYMGWVIVGLTRAPRGNAASRVSMVQEKCPKVIKERSQYVGYGLKMMLNNRAIIPCRNWEILVRCYEAVRW